MQSGTKVFAGATQVESWDYFDPLGETYTFKTCPFRVTFGVAQDITISPYASVDLIDANTVNNNNYSYTGTADFGSTIRLGSVGLFSNPAGTTPYGQFGLVTDSRTSYNTNSSLASVPEPSSILLFAGAFAALVTDGASPAARRIPLRPPVACGRGLHYH